MFFFFFQAEDGIRDYKVTGVQTCALPISEQTAGKLLQHDPGDFYVVLFTHPTSIPAMSRTPVSLPPSGSLADSCTQAASRSEERRVGKECRARLAGEA